MPSPVFKPDINEQEKQILEYVEEKVVQPSNIQ